MSDAKNSRVLARLSNRKAPGSGTQGRRRQSAGVHLRLSTTPITICRMHYAWVPFVQQSVAYLGGAGSGEQPTNLSVGEYVELRTGNEKGAQAEVQDPDGQRRAFARRRGDRLGISS